MLGNLLHIISVVNRFMYQRFPIPPLKKYLLIVRFDVPPRVVLTIFMFPNSSYAQYRNLRVGVLRKTKGSQCSTPVSLGLGPVKYGRNCQKGNHVSTSCDYECGVDCDCLGALGGLQFVAC